MFIVLAVLVVLGRTVLQLPFLPLIVRIPRPPHLKRFLTRGVQTLNRFEMTTTLPYG